MFHMIAPEQTFVNNSLRKFFLLLLPFQIESILSVICIFAVIVHRCNIILVKVLSRIVSTKQPSCFQGHFMLDSILGAACRTVMLNSQL